LEAQKAICSFQSEQIELRHPTFGLTCLEEAEFAGEIDVEVLVGGSGGGARKVGGGVKGR